MKRLPSRHLPVRLLGVGAGKVDASDQSQQELSDQSDRHEQRELDRVADQITARFGKLAIRRGARLDKGEG